MFDAGKDIEIIREVGRGTTATVYEGWAAILKRRVAVKAPALRPDTEPDRQSRRFIRECQLLAGLTSGGNCNIPRLYSVSENGAGRPYSVREFVEGSSLEQHISDRSIDLQSGLVLVAGVAQVVHWVHQRGIAHRNLSAANVMVAEDRSPWLIGFGRARTLDDVRSLPSRGKNGPVEADVRALQILLESLCAALREPLSAELEQILNSDAFETAEAFRAAVVSIVK